MYKKNIYYSIYYSIIGDIIGFDNYKLITESRNINNNNQVKRLSNQTINSIIEFISNGGYSCTKLKKKLYSNNIVFLLSVFDSTKSTIGNNPDEIINDIIKSIVNYYKNDLKKSERGYQNKFMKYLNRLIENNLSWKYLSYSDNFLSYEPSVRCIPIGYFYQGKANFKNLMKISINSSRITHNNAISYLSGFTSAYFCALAIENQDPVTWIQKLIKLFRDGTINSFLKTTITDKDEFNLHAKDKELFLFYLLSYQNFRFEYKDNSWKYLISSDNSNGNHKIFKYLDIRNKMFHEMFNKKVPNYFNPGFFGIDSVLIAYDSLLECNGSFEKLIYNSMLHSGLSHTTGCIAGAFFGAYYGKTNIPNNLLNIDKNILDELDVFFDK
jgi:ADP-ribosylglycohydrolase